MSNKCANCGDEYDINESRNVCQLCGIKLCSECSYQMTVLSYDYSGKLCKSCLVNNGEVYIICRIGERMYGMKKPLEVKSVLKK